MKLKSSISRLSLFLFFTCLTGPMTLPSGSTQLSKTRLSGDEVVAAASKARD